MVTIKLKEREVPLYYSVYEMKLIQEEICKFGDLQYVIGGKNKDDDKDGSGYGTPEHLNAIAKLIRILGNAGLEENGQEPDLTDKKIMRAMKPKDVIIMMQACLQALREGMESEIQVKESDEPVDVTLEDINRKKEMAS